ncbi:MAG: ABC transporter substrate-binding protein, partial [Alphaproteobacteria bacterium]
MTRQVLHIAAAIALLAPGLAAAQELRVGFINTLSGAGAGPGVEQTNAWKLGLEHEGWAKDGDKLGGVATKIFYGDDQWKPDVGLKEADRMIQQDKAH